MHRRKTSNDGAADSYIELRMLVLCAGTIFLGLVALPFFLRAADFNGDNLDDAWEAQYGISTSAYDATNLVGWWQFNGTNSTDTAVDRSGNNINGTLTNFPSIAYQLGLFSNALDFTTNAAVGFPTTNSVLSVGTNFTFSAWFQAVQTNAAVATIIADWHDAATVGWRVGASASGTTTITLYDGATQTVVQGAGSPVNLYDGAWHQIAATVDTNSVVTVYADGQPEATNSITAWSPGAAASFTFGAPTGTNNSAFNLDEVRLYNRAMEESEIPQLPATYSDLNDSGLTVFQDEEENLNPHDTNETVTPSFVASGLTGYYGTNTPVLTKTSGDAQTVSQNSFASNALVVHVADALNNPLANAPITFSIQSGSSGLLSQTSGGGAAASVSLTTDASGDATVYYKAGAETLKNNNVVVSAVSETGSISTVFTEYCGVQNGLVTWYDADLGVEADSSGYVSQWTDQSAAGNNATQSNPSILPSLVPSSLAEHSVIYFNGSSTYLALSRVIQDDFTMIVVFRSNMGTGSGGQWYSAGGIVDGETPGAQNDFGMSLDPAGEILTGVGNPDTSAISNHGGYNDGRGHVATFIRTESSGQFSQYLDSVLQSSQTGNTGTLDAPSQLTIGATQTLAQYFGGDVAEVLLYQRDLSSDEQGQVEGFLADKYGLYSVSATWPLAYSSDVQYQITANQWTKAEADAYVSFTGSSPSVPARGLLLWLKAGAGVSTDVFDNVLSWEDQSPSGHILNQTPNSGIPYRENDANGNPTIRFDGGQALYMPDYLPANGDVTIISLASADTPGNFQAEVIIGSPVGNTTRGLSDFYGSMNFDAYQNGAGGGTVSNAGEEAISTITYNRGSGAVNFYLRGNYNGYGNLSVNDLTSGFVVGNSVDFGAPWTGTISEVLVYNRVLSESERAQAEGQMADGYGVYDSAATWPLAYGEDIQELIEENQWSKSQADAYVASLGSNVREVVLTPPPGHYSSGQTVTVTSATSGATIYYTTDGSTPTTSSSSVANGGMLTVSATTRYRLLAANGTDANSPVTSAIYLIGSLGNLVAGDSFTMVNKPDGSVWTWGDDGRGQEGDNQANNPTAFPQQVSGLGTIVNVAAAGDHALAVDNGGNVWAWGADDQSQGGDGGTSDLLAPTQISGLSNIATVSAGSENGFAIDTSGNLYGWGNNDNGQLGDGTNNSESTPEAITSVSNVIKVVSNPNFTMVLESDGTVWASGSNGSGELGDSTHNNENIFQQVPTLTNIVDIAIGGANALVLRSDGTVWAWGNNWDGELGNGNFNGGIDFPEQVVGIPRAVAVEAVNGQCFVVLADGTLRSFGGNWQGTLGLGPNNSQSQDTPIDPGVYNVALLAAGSYHTVICTTTGAFYGWGDNSNYRLTEDFAPNNFTINSEVHDPAWQNVTQVASVGNTTLALKSDGTVWAVGEGDNGTLGNNNSFNTERPVQTVGLSGIIKIAGGNQNAFAIDNGGNLWGWGGNGNGQLGNGSTNWQTSPQQVGTVANVTDVAAGDNHMLAVESDGSVWAVGDDSQGELGDGTTNSETTPIQVSAPANAVKVAAGSNTSFALDSSGNVWAWGQNDAGQLGLGNTNFVGTPTQITSLPAMVAISACGNNGMGIDSSGNVWTWGEYGNSDGTPSEQSSISNATAVAAANYHGVVLKSDGTVWGLGAGWLGQLGNDSFNGNSTFTQFSGISGVQAISASYANTLLVKNDGTLSGFGGCGNGQLGANLGVYTWAHKPIFGFSMTEILPTVSMTTPATGATGTEGTAIEFEASATASIGSITKVDYYLNGVKIGNSTTKGSWDCSWAPTSSGEETFYAIAYDTAGVAQVSSPNTVIVAPSTDSVAAPLVSLASGTYRFPQIVTVSSSTPGVQIHYTANGQNPTTSSTTVENGSQILVSNTAQYKFLATTSNGGTSSVTTSNYTIGHTAGLPSPVTGFSESFSGSSQIILSWNPTAANVASIQIQKQNADGSWSTIATLTPDQTSYATSTLTNGLNTAFQAISVGVFGASQPAPASLPLATAPHYAVLDLGAGMNPVKITRSGFVLVNDSSGNYYRWSGEGYVMNDGSSVPLTVPSGYTLTQITDIGEDGSVVGMAQMGGNPYLVSWISASTVASNPTAATVYGPGGGYIIGQIYNPLAGLTSGNEWTSRSADGFYNSMELGNAGGGMNAYAPEGYITSIDYLTTPHQFPDAWTTGTGVIPLGVSCTGAAVCSAATSSPVEEVAVVYETTGLSPDPIFGNTAPPTLSYPLINAGSTFASAAETFPWFPVSVNSEGCALGSPSSHSPIVYWDGEQSNPLPLNFQGLCLDGEQDANGDAEYQILGSENDGSLALISMNTLTAEFDPQIPVRVNDLIGPAGWTNFAVKGLSYVNQYVNDNGAIVGTATYSGTDPTIAAGSHGVMLIPAGMAVDANRDGTIVMPNDASNPANAGLPVDTTSQAQPFRFWVNSFDESNEKDNPDSTTQDSASTTIVDERDLENFSRLWIYNNVPSGFFGSTKVQFGLKWKSVTGTPSIRLFHAYETNGGAKYVADENTASNQALGVTKSCLLDKSNLSVVASTGAAADFIFADGPDNNYSTTNSEQHFLFEGVGVGKGELVPVYLDSTGKEIGEGPGVWLDLENIKTMYKSSDADQFVQAWDETKQAIIFVHGWQMSPNGSRTFAEDIFKRLWHRGYKGRFCYFRWDTGNSSWFGNYVPVIGQDIDSYLANFNGSEHTAWHSGQALNRFIGSAVPSGYSKNLVAHSMGNIVAGSGFLNGLSVSHYAMLQAAVPSCCYDSSAARQQTTTSVVSYDVAGVTLNVTLWANPTPDNDPDPATQALAYRGRLASYGANNFYSFYQPDDEATQYYWEGNNAHFKPDSGFFGLAYYYSYTRSGSAGHKLAYSVAGGAQSSWVTDPLEAMPYADQSWSKAAGADAGTGGAVTGGINNETAYDFGSDHSAEFIMDIQGVETTFYHDLLNSMQIPQNPNP